MDGIMACLSPFNIRDWAHEGGHYDKLIAFVAKKTMNLFGGCLHQGIVETVAAVCDRREPGGVMGAGPH